MHQLEIREQLANLIFVQDCLSQAVEKLMGAAAEADPQVSLEQARAIVLHAGVGLEGIAIRISKSESLNRKPQGKIAPAVAERAL